MVAGNGSTFTYNFPFVADAASDIMVSSIASNGVSSLLATNLYTLTINPPATNQLWGIGGTVTYPLTGIPLTSTQNLLIQRTLPYTQNTSVQNQGNYYAQVTEQALDTLEMQIQQLAARTTQFRGIWTTGVQYFFGDIVQDGTNGSNTKNYYICQNTNTSGVWVTDLANGDWAISVVATVPQNISSITLTGDVTASGNTPIATTLATVNSNVGSFTNANITVNGKGLVTAASSGSVIGNPAMVLLSTQTISSSTPSVSDVTHITSAYSHYIWEISNLSAISNQVDAIITFQQAGVFVSTNSYYFAGQSIDTSGTAGGHASISTNSISATLGTVCISSSSLSPTTLKFEFWNPSIASRLNCLFSATGLGSASGFNIFGSGAVATTNPTTGIKLAMSSGNINACTANLYGIT